MSSRVTILVLALLIGCGLGVPRAQACTCIGATDAELLAAADEVFTGRAVSITPPPPVPEGEVGLMSAGDIAVTFATDRWWKGHRLASVTAYFGECGGFEVGESYLVFGLVDNRPALVADDCTGSWPLPIGAAMLAVLGPSLPALSDSTPPPTYGNALPQKPPVMSEATDPPHPTTSLPASAVWVGISTLALGGAIGFAVGRHARRAG